MLKNIIRHPIFLSTVLAVVFIGGLSAAHFWAPDTVTKTIWFIGIGVIALIFLAYQAVLFVRKRKQTICGSFSAIPGSQVDRATTRY